MSKELEPDIDRKKSALDGIEHVGASEIDLDIVVEKFDQTNKDMAAEWNDVIGRLTTTNDETHT